MEKDATSTTIQPEVTFDLSPETTVRDTIYQTEDGPEKMPRTSTPEPRQKKKRSSRKRRHSYREKSTSTSESLDESQSTSEEEIKKKTKRTSAKQKPEGKTKAHKTRVKDGRKLVDLSNRIRDDKGRILGYKPGTRSTAKRSRCKDSPTMTPQAKPTTEPQHILEQTS